MEGPCLVKGDISSDYHNIRVYRNEYFANLEGNRSKYIQRLCEPYTGIFYRHAGISCMGFIRRSNTDSCVSLYWERSRSVYKKMAYQSAREKPGMGRTNRQIQF